MNTETKYINHNGYLTKGFRALSMAIFLCALPGNTWAGTFEPIRIDQIPSGIPLTMEQPIVEDVEMFKGKRVGILASHGVEESEITYPYEYLTTRGATVDVIVPEWTPEGVSAVQYLKPTLWVKASLTFRKAKEVRYDLLVLTGGAWNAQVVRTDDDALSFISDHYKTGLPIAAICAGTALLINTGIAKDRLLTGSPTVAVDLVNAGAKYIDEALVNEDRLVTSRYPDDLPQFVIGIRKLLIGW